VALGAVNYSEYSGLYYRPTEYRELLNCTDDKFVQIALMDTTNKKKVYNELKNKEHS
jgi:hypothetical protein